MNTKPQLTLYYDGGCSLCMMEMQQLIDLNTDNKLLLVDLHSDGFAELYPHINIDKAMDILHGESADGEVLLGLDVTCAAWPLVNKHRWMKILRWPIIRHIADKVYLLFAKYRQPISNFLFPNAACQTCKLPSNKN